MLTSLLFLFVMIISETPTHPIGETHTLIIDATGDDSRAESSISTLRTVFEKVSNSVAVKSDEDAGVNAVITWLEELPPPSSTRNVIIYFAGDVDSISENIAASILHFREARVSVRAFLDRVSSVPPRQLLLIIDSHSPAHDTKTELLNIHSQPDMIFGRRSYNYYILYAYQAIGAKRDKGETFLSTVLGKSLGRWTDKHHVLRLSRLYNNMLAEEKVFHIHHDGPFTVWSNAPLRCYFGQGSSDFLFVDQSSLGDPRPVITIDRVSASRITGGINGDFPSATKMICYIQTRRDTFFAQPSPESFSPIENNKWSLGNSLRTPSPIAYYFMLVPIDFKPPNRTRNLAEIPSICTGVLSYREDEDA